MYGIGEDKTDSNGRACLMARRLSEAGVRFVQVTIGGWDHHGDIRNALPNSCAGADKPIAGLIRDLKRRGLLEETLIVDVRRIWPYVLESGSLRHLAHRQTWARAPTGKFLCSVGWWRGEDQAMVHGQTDDHGYRPIDGRVHLHDLHATMLHLLGIDHQRLTYPHQGRNFRLTDVYGNVVSEIIA